MVHHLVSGLVECFNGIGTALGPFPDNEEGRLHVIAVKDLDQERCVFVSPSGIEGEGYHLVVTVGAVNR